MGEVIHGVDAPLVAGVVVVVVGDAVDDGVAHVHVAARHVNLGTQHSGTLGELAVLHGLELSEVFLYRTVAVGGVGAGGAQVATLLAHGLTILLIHIG